VGYKWDANHGMQLIRQPSHAGGTQSLGLLSFACHVEVRLQELMFKQRISGLSQRRKEASRRSFVGYLRRS
jgi:hypothetical protein